MWLRNSLLITLILLTGCGFKPLYGKSTNAGISKALLAGISVDPVTTTDGRMGQQLKIELEDHLNPGGVVPGNPAYRLKVTLAETNSAIGVAPDGTISRYNVYLNSTYILLRNSDGRQVTTGSVSDVNSYNNVTNAYYSTYISQEDAIKRGVTELAELYRVRMAAYLSQNEGNPPIQDTTAPAPAPVPLQNVIQPAPLGTY